MFISQHVLSSYNLQIRKIILILTLQRKKKLVYCDIYKWTFLRWTLLEIKCLHSTSLCTLSDSNVIYHKFSHGAVSYTLNGENVYVMLEWKMTVCC